MIKNMPQLQPTVRQEPQEEEGGRLLALIGDINLRTQGDQLHLKVSPHAVNGTAVLNGEQAYKLGLALLAWYAEKEGR